LATLLLALAAGVSLSSEISFAQSANEPSRNSSSSPPARSQSTQPTNLDSYSDSNSGNKNNDRDSGQNSAATFQGRVVRSGNRLVLAAIDGTTYQLDNQQKAHNFLNQNVKVMGDLDATTGTIRINAINPF
jgi:flagellar capping protein FliD